MRVKVGEKVQSDKGLEGEVVGYTPDGYSAFVRLPYDGSGAHIVSLPLISLTRIEAYTHKPDAPA